MGTGGGGPTHYRVRVWPGVCLPSPTDAAGALELMPTFVDAEVQLRADNLPILFLDTCILIDVHPGARCAAWVLPTCREQSN